MANQVEPVILGTGLDTVTPPLLAEAGSLSDCLNYEISDTIGYRRIDGYENYDGFPNGAVSYYLRIRIVVSDSLDQPSITEGSILYRSNNGLNAVAIGTILGGPFNTDYYDITPIQNLDAFVLTEEFLELLDGGYISLSSAEGLLLLLGDDADLGSTFTIVTPGGDEFEVTIESSPADGSSLVEAEEYLANLRAYSETLRSQVQPAPAPVAGLYWFEDRLYAAVNAAKVSITVDSGDPQPTDYMRVRWNGRIYYTVNMTLESSDTVNVYSTYLMPYGTSAVVDDDLVGVAYDGTEGTTWQTNVEADGDVDYSASDVAVLGYFNNPDIATDRGFIYLPYALTNTFTGGTHAAGTGPAPTLNSNFYYVHGTDGTVLRVRLISTTVTDGEWTSDDAEGAVQVVVDSVVSGDRDYIINTDELHSENPTTLSSLILTFSGDASLPILAGTRALDNAGTRYQWMSANFYGQADTNSAWGVTGASRGFWANEQGYGTITAIDDEALDVPKYVVYHASSLLYGYDKGSLLRSVVGEPSNFSGVDGALEFATGDNITGLLEMPGDTIAVFGRRSIRKISGTTSSDIRMGTIASNSSCFDYTAVMIGQEAVFTGVNGVTTLQQTAAYGDFAGSRLSGKISNWLRPKLVYGFRAGMAGGAIMAYPIRNKNQYRLVLASGDNVIITLTENGPKCMRASYSLTGETNVPYAWSSEIDQYGQERAHVVWASTAKSSQVLELERGWGFNGRTFNHHIELVHLFFNSGANYGGIEAVRLHGQGYGVATLNVKAAGIETDYNQSYPNRIQDISIPKSVEAIYNQFQPVTNIVDSANWGLGIKLKFENTTAEGSTATEPPHICQALVLQVRAEGAKDG